MAELKIGDMAPDFTLKGTGDTEITLSDHRGDKNVMLVFYPLDFSPTCSVQIPDYNESLDKLTGTGTAVIAVNRESLYTHAAWSEHLGGVKFPLLSDMDLSVAKKYGVAKPQGFTERALFLIDKDGKIAFKNVEDSPADNTITVNQIIAELEKLR